MSFNSMVSALEYPSIGFDIVSCAKKRDCSVPEACWESSCVDKQAGCGVVQVLLLETAVAGIGPFNRKWKGFEEKGPE